MCPLHPTRAATAGGVTGGQPRLAEHTHTRWCTSTGVSPVRSLARPAAGYGSYRRGAEDTPAGVSVTGGEGGGHGRVHPSPGLTRGSTPCSITPSGIIPLRYYPLRYYPQRYHPLRYYLLQFYPLRYHPLRYCLLQFYPLRYHPLRY